ncbi:MAG: hypothetical protein MZV70_41885 [Desulfobacterales bacterium]|nr:hypothetical protein [Desulfobacterales bacterium]
MKPRTSGAGPENAHERGGIQGRPAEAGDPAERQPGDAGAGNPDRPRRAQAGQELTAEGRPRMSGKKPPQGGAVPTAPAHDARPRRSSGPWRPWRCWRWSSWARCSPLAS